jgi:hypothetical protein
MNEWQLALTRKRKRIESRLKEMVSRDKLEIPLQPQVWRIPCRLLSPV